MVLSRVRFSPGFLQEQDFLDLGWQLQLQIAPAWF
jgi:hypothetical protein